MYVSATFLMPRNIGVLKEQCGLEKAMLTQVGERVRMGCQALRSDAGKVSLDHGGRGAVSTARTPQCMPKCPPTHRNDTGFNTRTLAEIMKKKRAFSSVFHTKFFLVEISKNKYVSSTFFPDI